MAGFWEQALTSLFFNIDSGQGELLPVRKPNLFIVGAPKCGTSAMHSYLRQHPEIYMAPGTREPQYFGSDVKYAWFPKLSEETYLQLFEGATNEKLIGEKSTAYLASKVAAAEIKAFSPDAFIIAMLRNPVDMIYSLHSQMVFQGYETITDFYQALEDRSERSIDPIDMVPGTSLFSGQIYWNIAQYADQLERFFDTFGRERVHVIVYDDLRRDTPGVYAETLSFLGVDAEFRPDLSVVNPNKQLRLKYAAHPPALIRRIARAFLPKSVRQKIRNPVSRMNISYKPRPKMDPAVRNKLHKQFAGEVERVGKLLGRDLSHWSETA